MNVDAALGANTLQQPLLQLSPNPGNRLVTVKLPHTVAIMAGTIYVYSLQGQLIMKDDFMADYTINGADLPPGVYIVAVNVPGATLKAKMVVSR